MRSTPQLDPQTKEIGLGVRRPESVVSGAQRQINIINARLSGINQFQDWLSSRSSFDAFETDLQSRASSFPAVSDGDCTDARSIVESAFSSFSDWKGDSNNNTGVYSNATYDEYRGYLTTNGVASADADQHLQPIKRLFTPASYFIDAVVNDLGSYSDLETWLTNRGWSSSEATDLTDKLKEQFTWSELETFLSGSLRLEELLGEFEHSTTPGTPGEAGIDIGETDITITADRVDFEDLNSDDGQGVDPPETLSWTMQTASQNIDVGESLDIVATATASTDADWTATVQLTVNGAVDQSKQVEVTGSDTSVSFPFARSVSDAYEVSIGDASEITITVLP